MVWAPLWNATSQQPSGEGMGWWVEAKKPHQPPQKKVDSCSHHLTHARAVGDLERGAEVERVSFPMVRKTFT